ncbi:MAG: hypothetical protein L3J04_11700 [Robiginitomaculum sp.]|nr:hypothetical protein [Robiginitomaculum sp.]
MLNHKLLSKFAPALTFAVLFLGVWQWYLQPKLLVTSIIGAGFLPAVWLGMAIIQRFKAGSCAISNAKQQLRSGISAAGLILALAMVLSIAQQYQTIDAEMGERINSAILGAIVMIMGNFLPKAINPINGNNCEISTTQKIQRFAGWTFVVSGFLYSLIWVFAPIDLAAKLAMYALGLGVALIVTRFFWFRLTR